MFVRPLEGLLPGLVSERMQDPEGAVEKSSASLKTESKMFSFCPWGHKCRCPEKCAWERILKSERWRPGRAMLSTGTALPGGTSGSLRGDLQGSGDPSEKPGLGRACAVPAGRGKLWLWETEKREEQPVKDGAAARNGDSPQRRAPHPRFMQPPTFRKGWLCLKELGMSKVRHNFTPFCRDYLGLVRAGFTTGLGFFHMEICQALLRCNPF